MAAPWKITFTYLPEVDAVLAKFEGVELATRDDVVRWEREVDIRLRTFGRKVDLLIDLTGLLVRAGASRDFGAVRSEVLARYSNRSYRFGGDRTTVTSIHTTSVLNGAAANHYGTYAEALAALERDRRAGEGAPADRKWSAR